MQQLNRLVDLIRAVVRTVVLLQATAIFVIIVFTVVSRYVFNFVLSWSEEVPRYLLIWISFLGAAVGVDLKDHIAFDYVHKRFRGRLRALIALLINAAIFFFGWIMFWFGIQFVQDFGSDLMESIPFTNIWYYTAMPVSGFLIMLFSLRSQLNEWGRPAAFGRARRADHHALSAAARMHETVARPPLMPPASRDGSP
jgi:TRAP-type C4-dicarboxylate transport system permease small subunit